MITTRKQINKKHEHNFIVPSLFPIILYSSQIYIYYSKIQLESCEFLVINFKF